jgi:hypothetical protein
MIMSVSTRDLLELREALGLESDPTNDLQSRVETLCLYHGLIDHDGELTDKGAEIRISMGI